MDAYSEKYNAFIHMPIVYLSECMQMYLQSKNLPRKGIHHKIQMPITKEYLDLLNTYGLIPICSDMRKTMPNLFYILTRKKVHLSAARPGVPSDDYVITSVTPKKRKHAEIEESDEAYYVNIPNIVCVIVYLWRYRQVMEDPEIKGEIAEGMPRNNCFKIRPKKNYISEIHQEKGRKGAVKQGGWGDKFTPQFVYDKPFSKILWKETDLTLEGREEVVELIGTKGLKSLIYRLCYDWPFRKNKSQLEKVKKLDQCLNYFKAEDHMETPLSKPSFTATKIMGLSNTGNINDCAAFLRIIEGTASARKSKTGPFVISKTTFKKPAPGTNEHQSRKEQALRMSTECLEKSLRYRLLSEMIDMEGAFGQAIRREWNGIVDAVNSRQSHMFGDDLFKYCNEGATKTVQKMMEFLKKVQRDAEAEEEAGDNAEAEEDAGDTEGEEGKKMMEALKKALSQSTVRAGNRTRGTERVQQGGEQNDQSTVVLQVEKENQTERTTAQTEEKQDGDVEMRQETAEQMKGVEATAVERVALHDQAVPPPSVVLQVEKEKQTEGTSQTEEKQDGDVEMQPETEGMEGVEATAEESEAQESS